MSTGKREVYIPANKINVLKADFEKLKKKALKNGLPAPALLVTNVTKNKNITIYQILPDVKEPIPYKLTIPHVLCTISGEQPKINGWEVLVKIDHSNFQTGAHTHNMLATPNDGKSLSFGAEIALKNNIEHFAECGPNCDHCDTKRYRKETIVLYNQELDEVKQVGSTCIDDFLGDNALEAITNSYLMDGMIKKFENLDADEFRIGGGRNCGVGLIDTKLLMAIAAYSISKDGYTSSKMALSASDATFRKVTELYNGNSPDVIQIIKDYESESINKYIQFASSTLDWASQKKQDTAYNSNCLLISKVPSIDLSDKLMLATACSMPYQYNADLVRQSDLKNKGEHFGNIKERGDLKLTVVEIFDNPFDMYPSITYRMKDDDDRTFDWRSSYNSASPSLEIGTTYTMKGSIKEHFESKKGVKITSLTRCSDIVECDKETTPTPTFLKEKKPKKVRSVDVDLAP
ncbi:hypothetical protein ACTG16_23695 [Aeromonas sp. 23P]|uniref:hypothetical protein n=1 Tax=Aeromonas sp. 23P TaxID=3452716 RepID=UPI003F78C341|nr:hypothetical protein [Aeromonas veronii]